MIFGTLIFALAVFAATPAEVTIPSLPAKGSTSLALSPSGKADIQRTGTVTRVSIQIDRVAPAQGFIQGMNALVVWAVSPEGDMENIGELGIAGTKASLSATTKYDRFGILITAEPYYLVDRPGAAVAYRNLAPRDGRSMPISVQIGTYDYPVLPVSPVSAGYPSVILEARAALAIAQSLQAERLAESDFRQARVALDSMEELVKRGSPLELTEASAHESIRRSHRAILTIRGSR